MMNNNSGDKSGISRRSQIEKEKKARAIEAYYTRMFEKQLSVVNKFYDNDT